MKKSLLFIAIIIFPFLGFSQGLLDELDAETKDEKKQIIRLQLLNLQGLLIYLLLKCPQRERCFLLLLIDLAL